MSHMMILRAIPLSLAILLPRILLVPVFVILYALAGLAISIITAVLMIVSPVIALIVSVLLALALTSFPMMVGLRLGFNQRRHEVIGTYGSLVVPAMIYGFIEGFGILVITVIGTVIFTAISPELSFTDLGDAMALADDTAVETAVGSGDTSAVVIFLVCLLAASALRAALLVPLAGAAAGRDANGGLHTPLVGFGVGLLPLTVLVILSYIALPLIALAVLTIAGMFGSAEVFGNGTRSNLDSFGLSEILFLVGIWIGWIWIFCLQCAGGVLCYLSQRDGYVKQKAKTPEAARMDSVDARALWKSRM